MVTWGTHGSTCTLRAGRILSGLIMAMMLLTPVLAAASRANAAPEEIPHENYDIANPDLETVVNLLNISIRASEETLKDFFNETMVQADEELALVDRILVPAQQVLSKIEYVASSYDNLTELLPPFMDLRTGMRSFDSFEKQMIGARAQVMALRDIANLTDEDLVAALRMINEFNGFLANMNGTIDSMLVAAENITNKQLDGRLPFRPNDLKALIEKLREMVRMISEQMTPVIHNEINWGNKSFLILWIENSTVYLGERINGGGYLYYNGSFRPHHLIHIQWDGSDITGTATDDNGTYRFALRLSLNASLLGEHKIRATARSSQMNLSSDEVTVTVILMPTFLKLDIDKSEMSVNETVSVVATLKDARGRAISNAVCQLDYSSQITEANTSNDGIIARSYTGFQLGFGLHEFSASYVAELPYLPSQDGPLNVTVSIPTHIDLGLFSERFVPGYYVVGSGSLLANSSQTLPTQRLAIYIDDILVQNASTDVLGEFALSLSSKDLAGGTHTLRVAFESHGVVWRYSEAEVPFLITTLQKRPYPFFPVFPGWQTGPPSTIKDLFFGPYAYYVWLFMLAVLAIIVKTSQTRKARATRRKESVVEPIIAAPTLNLTTSAATGSDLALPDWSSATDSPLDPNSRIIWLYNLLIEFLRKKRRITITDDMTHWEVARLLRKLGYPKESVEKVTYLFEKAFYSGDDMTDVDSVGMSIAMDGLRAGGVKDAQ